MLSEDFISSVGAVNIASLEEIHVGLMTYAAQLTLKTLWPAACLRPYIFMLNGVMTPHL